jgi:hypothetical protein
MKNNVIVPALAAVAFLLLAVSPVSAKPRTLVGVIAGYECGDNCYLTIRDKKGEEHAGLCAAPECEPWNAEAQLPETFMGKRVEVTVGVGDQVDGSGTVMGQMDAFTKIIFK